LDKFNTKGCTFFVEQNPADTRWRWPGYNRFAWLYCNLLLGQSPMPNMILLDYFRQNNHGIALAMLDFDESTASIVEMISRHHVKFTAWIVLPEKDGYWSNSANVPQTVARIKEFLDWMRRYNFTFRDIQCFGLDWEVPIQIHMKSRGKKLYPNAMRNYRAGRQTGDIKYVNDALTAVKERGLGTELYTMPRLLTPLFGLTEQPKVDRRVIMAYSSVVPLIGHTRPLMKLMRMGYPTASVAYGIATGVYGSSPGRDFGDGVLPHHLTLNELASCIKATPNGLGTHLFAMNHSNVVSLWENAYALAQQM
jgi:hypothetical protein